MIVPPEGLKCVRTHPRANEGVVRDVGNSCKYMIDKDGRKMKVGPNAMLKKHWIKNAIKKPGALRKSLDVKSGKDIPLKSLRKAGKKGGLMGKRANLALTLRSFNK